MTFSRGRFCTACIQLFFHQPPEGSDVLHTTGAALKTCAEARVCDFCSHLWDRLGEELRADVAGSESDGLRCSVIEDFRRSSEVHLDVVLPISEEVRVARYGSNMAQSIRIVLRSQRGTSYPTATGCTFNQKMSTQARAWVENCISRHPNSATSEPIVPTRLIDVGSLSTPTAKLCQDVSKARYIALSHRWAGKIVQTLQANKAAFMQSIPQEILSKTFNDAMQVTRMVGIRYVWIDSLCIVQDDNMDWTREAARMADYYQHAYCTLSASCADSLGLIRDRDPTLVGPLCLNTLPASGTDQSLFKVLKGIYSSISRAGTIPPGHLIPEGSYMSRDLEAWSREIDQSPLSIRGWIYQERMLSSRILHFGRTRVFFECLDQQCSEDQPRQLEKGWSRTDFRSLSPQMMQRKMQTDGSRLAGIAYIPWMSTIRDYSSCSLTKAGDRLPALAGLAQRFKDILNAERHDYQIETTGTDVPLPMYFEGVWFHSRFIMHCLVWSTLAEQLQPRDHETTSPSWSFGKTTAGIAFGTTLDPGETFENLAVIKKLDVQWKAGVDTNTAMWLGRIEPGSGALWIAADLLPVQLDANALHSEELSRERGTWPGHPSVMIDGERQRFAFTVDELRLGTDADNFGWSGQYFFLPILKWRKAETVHGMLLELEESEPGCYRRIGGGSVELSSWSTAIEACSNELDRSLFLGQADEGRVIVKII